MSSSFAVIGGDLRISYLAKMIADDGNNVYTYGISEIEKTRDLHKDDFDVNNRIKICENLKTATEKADIIISSLPFSKDGENIYAPFYNKKIAISDLVNCIENKVFFAGSIQENFYDLVKNKNVNVVDLMKQEDLTILNTIATAEGAINEAIVNTGRILHGSNVLILGFGRVAKVLAKKLVGMDAKVTCAARKDMDFAWMETMGYENTNINALGENLRKYDIIFNTVPQLILDKNKLEYVKKECLLIDLASKPGGIDVEYCKNKGLKFVWALALPGKVAPITSAEFIKNTIYNCLKNT